MLATRRTLEHLHETGSLHGIESTLMGFDDRQLAVDLERWSELDRRYTAP